MREVTITPSRFMLMETEDKHQPNGRRLGVYADFIMALLLFNKALIIQKPMLVFLFLSDHN